MSLPRYGAKRQSPQPRSRMFNSSNETACGLPIVRSYVRKNLIEIGKCVHRPLLIRMRSFCFFKIGNSGNEAMTFDSSKYF